MKQLAWAIGELLTSENGPDYEEMVNATRDLRSVLRSPSKGQFSTIQSSINTIVIAALKAREGEKIKAIQHIYVYSDREGKKVFEVDILVELPLGGYKIIEVKTSLTTNSKRTQYERYKMFRSPHHLIEGRRVEAVEVLATHQFHDVDAAVLNAEYNPEKLPVFFHFRKFTIPQNPWRQDLLP